MCDRCDAARGYASDGYGGCVCDTNFHDVDGVCTPCTSIPGCQQYSNGCSACNACNATAGYVADTPNNDGIVTRCLFSATFEDFDIASISGGDSTCSANFTDNFIYRNVHWQRASASSMYDDLCRTSARVQHTCGLCKPLYRAVGTVLRCRGTSLNVCASIVYISIILDPP